jgi:hypothetical protein
MKTLGFTVGLFLACVMGTPPVAADTARPAAPQVAQTDAAQTDAAQTDAAQDEAPPDIAALMENVSTIAEGLQNSVTDLDDRIEASLNSAAQGEKVLTEMLLSARALQDSLGRDSDVWTDLNRLMDNWRAKHEAALKQSETKPEFGEIAKLWQARLDEAMKLRESILQQAAESVALVDAIESQREIVLAYYDVQAADKVLESMRAMSEDLTQMNESMRGIVSQAGVVVGNDVGQQ